MEIAEGIYVIKNLYPPDLCAAYILLSERIGYETVYVILDDEEND